MTPSALERRYAMLIQCPQRYRWSDQMQTVGIFWREMMKQYGRASTMGERHVAKVRAIYVDDTFATKMVICSQVTRDEGRRCRQKMKYDLPLAETSSKPRNPRRHRHMASQCLNCLGQGSLSLPIAKGLATRNHCGYFGVDISTARLGGISTPRMAIS